MGKPLLKCFVCGSEDKEKTYLACYNEGVEKIVCTRCLPTLIHGAH
jgi:hypothetical protein